MSNVNTSKKQLANNPFQPANSNMSQPVGLNYGDRMKYQKVQQPTPSAPQGRPAVDQFDARKKADASGFGANATYKAQRRQNVAGYKPALLDGIESGTMPRTRQTGVPDDTILNFLDKVIGQGTAKKTQFIKA